MPGNIIKPEDGAYCCFYTERRGAVDEAHRFWSLPSVKQELASPGSAKMRRTRSLFLGSTCVCVCGAVRGLCFCCTDVVPSQGSYQREQCLKSIFRVI